MTIVIKIQYFTKSYDLINQMYCILKELRTLLFLIKLFGHYRVLELVYLRKN